MYCARFQSTESTTVLEHANPLMCRWRAEHHAARDGSRACPAYGLSTGNGGLPPPGMGVRSVFRIIDTIE
jgi:hypothetical protein